MLGFFLIQPTAVLQTPLDRSKYIDAKYHILLKRFKRPTRRPHPMEVLYTLMLCLEPLLQEEEADAVILEPG